MPSPAMILRSCLMDLALVQYPVSLPGVVDLPGTLPEVDPSTLWCFTNSMSDEYDQAMLIKDAPGMDWGREMLGGKRHVHPGVIITIRVLDPVIGFDIAMGIMRALDEQILMMTTVTPEDNLPHYVHAVKRTTPLIDMGEEIGKKHQLWSCNARISFQDQEPTLG